MKPIYFPYTFVKRKTALEISAFFKDFVIYQPSSDPLPAEMQVLVDRSVLEVRIPDASEASRFKSVVKDFRHWGEQQRSGEEIQAAVLRSSKDPVPFFDEFSKAQIVAGIRQQLAPSPESDVTDSTFEARVFLALAQEFDRQSQEVNGEVHVYRDKVKDLFADINIEGNNPIREPLSGLEMRQSDRSEFMVLRRLEAWEHLYRKDTAEPGVLLTTSPLILEHIIEHIPSIKKLHELTCAIISPETDGTFEEWQQSLLKHLNELAQAQWPVAADLPPHAFEAKSSDAHLSLSVYIVPDLMPRDCLAMCIPPSQRRSAGQAPPAALRNTVIGLIQPSELLK